MLNGQQKNTILLNEEVNYYDKITNKDSLNEVFFRLNGNREIETLNWFSKSKKMRLYDLRHAFVATMMN